MKTRKLITLAGAVVLFCSCIPSVNPFYTDKDVVFDARLVGDWQEKDKPDDPEIWKFEKSGDNSYKLTVWEPKNKHGQFNARLFKLKQDFFLDIIPTDCNYAPDQAGLVAASMFPGHLLVHVLQFEPALKLAFFDFDWLEKYLEKNPKALAHHQEDKSIVLTASTRDLQKFVLKHLGEGELFAKSGELIRRTNEVSAATQMEHK